MNNHRPDMPTTLVMLAVTLPLLVLLHYYLGIRCDDRCAPLDGQVVGVEEIVCWCVGPDGTAKLPVDR